MNSILAAGAGLGIYGVLMLAGIILGDIKVSFGQPNKDRLWTSDCCPAWFFQQNNDRYIISAGHLRLRLMKPGFQVSQWMILGEGQEIPWYMGVVYTDTRRAYTIMAPVPINYVWSWLRRLWFFLKIPKDPWMDAYFDGHTDGYRKALTERRVRVDT